MFAESSLISRALDKMSDIPPVLKSIQPYLKVSKNYANRDPIVSYFCQMYAVQLGISLAKKDDTAKGYLLKLMDTLQERKREMRDEDAFKDETIAQSHIEEVALNMFDNADNKDRKGEFDRNMIKWFYTAGHLFTVLKQFGELTDEVESKMKYSKWKAIEISRCLNNGITPTPGPPGGIENEGEYGDDESGGGYIQTSSTQPPGIGFIMPNQPTPPFPGAQPVFPPPEPTDPSFRPIPAPRKNIPSPTSSPTPQRRNIHPPPPVSGPQPNSGSIFSPSPDIPVSASGVQLSVAQVGKVQKYCKYASSSLDYQDYAAAIDYLEKSLKLLRTGQE